MPPKDQFADLFSSFANKPKEPSPSLGQMSQSSRNTPLMELASMTQTPAQSEPVQARSPSVQPLFAQSLQPNRVTPQPEPKRTPIDDIFDAFNATPANSQAGAREPATQPKYAQSKVYQEENLFEGFETSHSPIQQATPVVDEVRDMEIAQLCSLGMSVAEATEKLERGVTYDDILHNMKPKSKAQPALFDMESDVVQTATNWFNKGKDMLQKNLAKYNDGARPAWMRDVPDVGGLRLDDGPALPARRQQPGGERNQAQPKFQDLLSEDSLPNFRSRSQGLPGAPPRPPQQSPPIVQPKPQHVMHAPQVAEGNLLGDDAFAASTPQQSISISAMELSGYEEFKTKGNNSFKNGDFHTAFEQYTKSLNSLPLSHPFRVIALSNLMTAQLKIGENKAVIANADEALSLCEKQGEIVPGKSFKSFWIKILTKKATAFEALEKYQDALAVYKELIENGGASKAVMEGKNRCQSVLAPKPVPKASPKPSTPKPATASEATKRVQNAHQQEAREEAERYALLDKVNAKVDAWKKGGDLRTLLSTLDMVLWPELNYKPVASSDLVLPKKVKLAYLKAAAKIHPDKLQGGLSTENKMIAEQVFVVLTEKWESFE